MAEVGRAAVRDPGALLPGGFWAAVAVWLERPQVANKRLCGVRLEARRSVAEPRAEDCGQRPNAGREQEERAAAAPGLRPPDGALGPRPSSGPDLGTAGRGPEGARRRPRIWSPPGTLAFEAKPAAARRCWPSSPGPRWDRSQGRPASWTSFSEASSRRRARAARLPFRGGKWSCEMSSMEQ